MCKIDVPQGRILEIGSNQSCREEIDGIKSGQDELRTDALCAVETCLAYLST